MLLSNRIKDLGCGISFFFVFFIKPNRETRLPLPALLKGSGVSERWSSKRPHSEQAGGGSSV